ncbi:MAG: hypothetical protein HC886_02865 [Leptolyngbyaceae cyanobacterium SM1_1_3]|nr:hypothetical protein [Leptolyngbyaceae cyanobacterium SM1_1_3]NJM85501.1 hypothetical protein [Leptolyngbyaceae cyanobacterium RM2_2_21]NJN03488.1 hypothetical protein [Leptolyngbyaceae cyanobacterium RM1_1_2]NJO09487.1 hypothetical protein [Leptolyngbyaceae cyanobacterium SL_1_1]
MLGTFQQSNLRIEVNAPEAAIREQLTSPSQFRQWLWPQRFSTGLPTLTPGLTFSGYIGPVEIQHRVESVSPNRLELLLCGGIDGFHHWYWGDGWLQSNLEGVSLLPLNLAQTLSLFRLRQSLEAPLPVSG